MVSCVTRWGVCCLRILYMCYVPLRSISLSDVITLLLGYASYLLLEPKRLPISSLLSFFSVKSQQIC